MCFLCIETYHAPDNRIQKMEHKLIFRKANLILKKRKEQLLCREIKDHSRISAAVQVSGRAGVHSLIVNNINDLPLWRSGFGVAPLSPRARYQIRAAFRCGRKAETPVCRRTPAGQNNSEPPTKAYLIMQCYGHVKPPNLL